MLDFVRKTFLGLATVVALGAGAAGAATIITDTNTYTIDYGDVFLGVVTGNGEAGEWFVQFDALSDPISAFALATVSGPVTGFTNLMMSWIAVSDDTLLAAALVPQVVIPLPTSPPSNIGYTLLNTVFTVNGVDGGDDSRQFLVFSWTDSEDNAGFDVRVAAAVPVPAAGLLLLGALGGLGLLRRRKSV